MLDTALVQLRFGLALIAGRRIRVDDVRRMLADILVTRTEFGETTLQEVRAAQIPELDPEARRTVNEQRMRRAARRAYTETVYYRELFDSLGVQANRLTLDQLHNVPITPKSALKTMPEAFISKNGKPCFQAFTTGTTGTPTAVWFSRYELDLAAAFSAVSLVSNTGIGPEDVVQLTISTRALLGVSNIMQACHLIGAVAYPIGLIDPTETLARLATPMHLPGKKPQVSVMTTYPSYLAALVERGEALGYGPEDFGLERIIVGGEILTAALRQRAEALFGARVEDSYGMTEIFPLAGMICSQGHCHISPEQGLIEVLRLDDQRPAEPGEEGTLVVTPFFPYRDTTLLFRLDTGDVVRRLENASLTCELARIPATSGILGKKNFCISANGRRYFQRDVMELLEGERAIPLPCRYALDSSAEGFDLHVLVRLEDRQIARRLEHRAADMGLPLRQVRLYTNKANMPPTVPVRADLREVTFTQQNLARMNQALLSVN